MVRDEDTDWSVFQERNEERAAESTAALAAPVTMPLGSLGLLILSPPGPKEEMFMRMEFRRQCLELLKTPLQQIAEDVKLLTPAQAAVAIREAVAMQAGSMNGKGDPTEDMLFSRLQTPEGCAFRVWLVAREAHPDLKLADVRKEITADNVIETLANLALAFGLVDEDGDDGEKKAAGTSTSRESGGSPGPAFTES